ncbi:MAG: GyrI-like domain-containing protein [Cyanophyceae cyanobacterium]
MQEVKIDSFTVTGPSVRTNNALEASDSGKIPLLWAQFYASRYDASEAIYGVYSDYESDASGDFTVTAGTKSEGSNTGLSIRPGVYLSFPAEGEMPAAIINAWKAVWDYFSEGRRQTRAYETDFEQYNGPTSAVIYIGIKSSS